MAQAVLFNQCSVADCLAERVYAHGLCRRHYKAEHYQLNLADRRERRRAEYQRDKEAAKAAARAWYMDRSSSPDGRALLRTQRRSWEERNPDKVAANRSTQKAKRAAAPIVDVVVRSRVWERDAGICHICSKPAQVDDWHMDHVTPLARGGEHSYANVAVSHPACNLRKGAKVVC